MVVRRIEPRLATKRPFVKFVGMRPSHRYLAPVLATFLFACSSTATTGADPDAAAVAYREGDAQAPIKMMYFDDLVCEDCRTFSRSAAEPLRTTWVGGKKVQLTVIDLAWHRGSVAGSAAMTCAIEQGHFWEMHELLFERQDKWKRETDIPAALQKYATELKLDTAKFATCAARKDHQRRLDAADEAARRHGVRGTPAFIINGKSFFGAQDWAWMERVLTAYAAGMPDSAPPPPMGIPTKKVVDSARLRVLEDSVARLSKKPKF